MQIVVAVKPVPEAETRLRVAADGRSLESEAVKYVLAGYDESAIEQALLLREKLPGSHVTALTAGPAPRSEEVLRSCLALGVDAAHWVELPPGAPIDPVGVARVLAAAIRSIPHDLVLVGKHAGDRESGIVGPALGELLDVPDFGAVVDLRPETNGSGVTFRRSTEAGLEQWTSPLPCVVALQQAWNDPRTAKLPAILKSRKTAIARTVGAVDAPPRVEASRFELPAPRSGAKMIEFQTPQEAATKLVKLLREEAKVFP